MQNSSCGEFGAIGVDTDGYKANRICDRLFANGNTVRVTRNGLAMLAKLSPLLRSSLSSFIITSVSH